MPAGTDEWADLDGIKVRIRLSPRARRLRLTLDGRTGEALLVLPPRSSRRRALAWAAGHRAWLVEKLAALPARQPILPGATIPYRGSAHRIEWSPERRRTVEQEAGRLLLGGPADLVERRIVRWMRAQALQLLGSETSELAERLGRPVASVTIGDARSRWGSCSSRGDIRYNWRLVMAPDFVRRATVAHEVAHLVHFDHGRSFHALVEWLLGEDPAEARAWLRQEGASLHRVGSRVRA